MLETQRTMTYNLHRIMNYTGDSGTRLTPLQSMSNFLSIGRTSIRLLLIYHYSSIETTRQLLNLVI